MKFISFSDERLAVERALANLLHRREQTTLEIERGGRSGPLADDSRQRVREAASDLIQLIEQAEFRAGRGEL